MLPLVSVAIPLYRSGRFLPVIFDNIDNLTWPNLEVMVSDRHGLDDAIHRIADRYRSDSRIRILQSDDGIGWVDHYNLLAKEAAGEFFMWMPHDDSFPPGYLERLIEPMIEHQQLCLCYGDVEPVSLDGTRRQDWRYVDTPGVTPSPPGLFSAIVFYMVHPWVPFRGLIRRSVMIDRGLFIEHCVDEFGADANWVMSMLHAAPLMHVPGVMCIKRFYTESTHRATPINERAIRSSVGSLARMVGRAGCSPLHAVSLAFFAYVYRHLQRLRLVDALPDSLVHRVKRRVQRK